MNIDITSLRTTLKSLENSGELITIDTEISPIYEIAALQKALDNGPVLLFENIAGYPEVRHVGNIFARRERLARIFGVDDPKKFKFKCLEAIKNQIPSNIVEEAPCQEEVIEQNVDILQTLPALKYSEEDPGRMLSGGIILITGEYAGGGSELSFKRMHFRGPNWASIAANPVSHAGLIRYVESRGDRVPMTINIGAPPSVMLTAAGGFLHTVIPLGSDELAIAGGLQGFPVNIVKAKTVDAYAIAEAEWVIEGYWLPNKIWESDEAEKIGEADVAPFFPEWTGYMGRSRKVYEFHATAITHRKDRPVFYAPLAHSFGHDYIINSFREACFLEMANRIIPNLVTDVTIPISFGSFGGVIFQVKKRRPLDEGFQKDILLNAMAAAPGLPTAVVVDEDVNIYSADDLLWALNTRVDPDTGVFRGPKGSKSFGMFPMEVGRVYPGGLAIDATVPLSKKGQFKRGRFAVDKIDPERWITRDQLVAIKAQQSEFARYFGEKGY